MSDPLLKGLNVPEKLYFRIGEIAELVGVDTHVLRYWESEFTLSPHRSSSGQRLYRKQELVQLLRIKQLVHSEGYTIAGARRILQDGLPDENNTLLPVEQVKNILARIEGLRQQIQDYKSESLEV
jgi:DNA-binding transcriptional MerR regulator